MPTRRNPAERLRDDPGREGCHRGYRNTCVCERPRLDLVAATIEHLAAELEDTQRFADLLGAVVLPSWPPGEYDRHAISYFHDRLAEGAASAAGWYVWYAIRRRRRTTRRRSSRAAATSVPHSRTEPSRSVIRSCPNGVATATRPNWYKPSCSGRSMYRDVRRILAEAEVANVASIGVLERCGFRRMGTGREPHYDRFQRDRGGEGTSGVLGEPALLCREIVVTGSGLGTDWIRRRRSPQLIS